MKNDVETKSKMNKLHSIVIVQDSETHEAISPHPYKGRYSIRYDEVHGWPPTPEE